MKMVADFMVEVPLLKRDDTVTKARQILRDDSFREIYIHDGKKNSSGISIFPMCCKSGQLNRM